METNQPFQERPSALPAAAVLRVPALVSEPDRHLDRAFPGVPGTGWFVGGGATVAARNAVRLLADNRIAGKGTSVLTAIPGSTGSVQQMDTKQINVVTAYRKNGVAGAPPRGRPN